MTMLPMMANDPLSLSASFPVPKGQFVQLPSQPKASGGMFGAGGVGRNIAGMIGDLLMTRAGMKPMYVPAMMQQRKLSLQAQMDDRKRQEEMQDQIALHQVNQSYDAAHPVPGEQERMLQRYMDPSTPAEEKQLLGSMLQHPVAMDVTNPDGSVTRQYVYPGTIPQQSQVPTSPVGKLTPLGAGGPGASPGGFPR